MQSPGVSERPTPAEEQVDGQGTMICNNVAIPCSHARIGNTLNLKLFGCGHLLKPPLRFPLVMAIPILWALPSSQKVPEAPRGHQKAPGGSRRWQAVQGVPGDPRRFQKIARQ